MCTEREVGGKRGQTGRGQALLKVLSFPLKVLEAAECLKLGGGLIRFAFSQAH